MGIDYDSYRFTSIFIMTILLVIIFCGLVVTIATFDSLIKNDDGSNVYCVLQSSTSQIDFIMVMAYVISFVYAVFSVFLLLTLLGKIIDRSNKYGYGTFAKYSMGIIMVLMVASYIFILLGMIKIIEKFTRGNKNADGEIINGADDSGAGTCITFDSEWDYNWTYGLLIFTLIITIIETLVFFVIL